LRELDEISCMQGYGKYHRKREIIKVSRFFYLSEIERENNVKD